MIITTSGQHRLCGADAGKTCWRVSAIYHCCIRFGKSRTWALLKIREIFPDGTRDVLVENWWSDMSNLQERHVRLSMPEPATALRRMAA